MSADVTTFDPTHIDPWFAVLVVLVLLVWFAVLEIRAAIDDKRAKDAQAYYEARQAHNRANVVPFAERCMVPSCTKRSVPPHVHGWRRCTDHMQAAS